MIAHICNNKGRWGSGFTLALSQRWESPERFYRQWYRANVYEGIPFRLGETQFIPVGYNPKKTEDRGIWVANMIAQNGFRTAANPRPVCYESLRTCLEQVAQKAIELQAQVIMPRIGCDRGGGDWKDIEPMLQECLVQKDLQVTVYDPKKWT
jgi:O-acetyl-ADP-ribose deacetylase (regulator of RNase III)